MEILENRNIGPAIHNYSVDCEMEEGNNASILSHRFVNRFADVGASTFPR